MMGEAHDKLHLIEQELSKLVKRANPDPAWWLDSDAGQSYCHGCVRDARARELGMVVTPPFVYQLFRNDYDDDFEDGVCGGYYGQGAVDSTEACTTCGKQLAYSLTDYGVSSEVDHFIENPLTSIGPEQAYELDRLFYHGIWEGADKQLTADLIAIGEQALAVARAQAGAPA